MNARVHFSLSSVHSRRSFPPPDVADTTPPRAFPIQKPFLFEAIQQAIRLWPPDAAQVRGLPPCDPTVLFHVLQDHLLLLQWLEPTLADVPGLVSQGAIGRGGQVPGASLLLATLLDQSGFYESMQRTT